MEEKRKAKGEETRTAGPRLDSAGPPIQEIAPGGVLKDA